MRQGIKEENSSGSIHVWADRAAIPSLAETGAGRGYVKQSASDSAASYHLNP